MYKPILHKISYDNPADKYGRIFQFIGTNPESVLDSKSQWFEADLETSLTADGKDQQAVGYSLAPKNAPYSRFAAVSTTYTDNQTCLQGLLDTIHYFCCTDVESYVYFHNLDYDGIFVINYLMRNLKYKQVFDTKLTSKHAKNYDKSFTVLYNNDLYEIRLIYKGKCVILRNSFKLWSASIDEISEELVKINAADISRGDAPSFPLVRRKSDLRYDYDKVRRFGEQIDSESMLYMINDSLVGVAILQMFEKFGRPGVSCSGMAYKLAVKSFKDGILTTDVVKYILSQKLHEIVEKNESRQFIKVVVKNDITELYVKTYYTVDYMSLSSKSDEYLTSISTQYISHARCMYAITDINTLFDIKEIELEKKIFDAVKDVSKFKAFSDLRKNIVFLSYRQDQPGELIDNIVNYLKLPELKQLKQTDSYKKYGKNKICKSFDYYYQSVFTPLTFGEDAEIRPAYRGGLSTAVERFCNTMQHNIVSIDINSSYPYQMSTKPLPYGKAEIFENPNFSDYKEIDNKYKTYIIQFQASYRLQYPYNPIVSQKEMYGYAKFRYHDTQFRQINEDEWLYMTNTEFDLFVKTHNVNVEDIYINKIWAYKSVVGLFDTFVSKLYQVKQYYKGTALYEPVKQMLNSVYGRYAMNRFKFAYFESQIRFNEKDIIYFAQKERDKINYEDTKGSYLPVSIFITSYARCQLIETANRINETDGKVFYYDTDSLHFTADSVKIINDGLFINGIEVATTNNELGAWKIEVCKKIEDSGEVIGADDGLYACSKRYIETDADTNLKNIRFAGVPRSYKKDMDYDDISIGATVNVNKKVRTKSGIILKSINKTIEYTSNIYNTTSGIVLSYDYYDVGDTITDMYKNDVIVTKIVYKSKQRRIFNLI